MKEIIFHTFEHTFVEVIKLIPFLFLTYLLMEYIEHKTKDKTKNIVKKSGKAGPFFGALLGVFPQCGFSAAAANLFTARIITMGTLIAVFLSTSDEMLPILISKKAPITLIITILGIKFIIGMISGFGIDLITNVINKKKNSKYEDSKEAIEHICKHEHCDCEHDGILKSSIKHTLSISLFIFVITYIINIVIHSIGKEVIEEFIAKVPFVGIIVSALVGLIPNCAGSVIITELFLNNLISFGSMIAGLLVGSGIGILVLFKTNKNIKENLKITSLLLVISIICGFIIDIIKF